MDIPCAPSTGWQESLRNAALACGIVHQPCA